MPFAEAWALVENGTIADAKTIILLAFLRLEDDGRAIDQSFLGRVSPPDLPADSR